MSAVPATGILAADTDAIAQAHGRLPESIEMALRGLDDVVPGASVVR